MAYRLAIRGRFDCCVPLFQLLKVEKRLGTYNQRERGGGEEGEGMVRGGNHLQRMARSGGRTGEMKRERGRD